MFNFFNRNRWELVSHGQLDRKIRQVMLAHDAFTALLGALSSRIANIENDLDLVRLEIRSLKRSENNRPEEYSGKCGCD